MARIPPGLLACALDGAALCPPPKHAARQVGNILETGAPQLLRDIVLLTGSFACV